MSVHSAEIDYGRAEDAVAGRIAEAYDTYFRSHTYAARYPAINPRSGEILFGAARGARRILDFGCGAGRYVLPLLDESEAAITAYDICPAAIDELRRALAQHPRGNRVTPVPGEIDRLDHGGPYDLVMLMFGVLSHIPGRRNRLATLRRLHGLMRDADGAPKLILSVPNVLRRFHRQSLGRLANRNRPFEGESPERGDILYERDCGGARISLFYHLYSPASIRADLGAAGFRNVSVLAESLLPESAIVRSPRLARLDRQICKALPSWLAYGILVIAEA